jgi:hypothetical protein
MEGNVNKAGLFLPKNTIGYQKARPFIAGLDLSELTSKNLSYRIKCAMGVDGSSKVATLGSRLSPEKEAVAFYTLNHLFSHTALLFSDSDELDELHTEVVSTYVEVGNLMMLRALYYLVQICLQEHRHGSANSGYTTHFTDKFGPTITSYVYATKGKEYFLSNPPSGPAWGLMCAVDEQFTKFGYGGSFGGKPWANVARCGWRLLKGDTTPEVFLDTIWTLAHNTGPIFNKGYLYNTQNNSLLLRVLDVQRSGQMPQAVMTDSQITASTYDSVAQLVAKFVEVYPELGQPVDWQSVMDLGAVGNYSSLAKDQKPQGKKKSGAFDSLKAKPLQHTAQFTIPPKNLFTVTPDLTVSKISRSEIK